MHLILYIFEQYISKFTILIILFAAFFKMDGFSALLSELFMYFL